MHSELCWKESRSILTGRVGWGEFAKIFKAWRKALSALADVNRPVCESNSHLLPIVFVLFSINLFVI